MSVNIFSPIDNYPQEKDYFLLKISTIYRRRCPFSRCPAFYLLSHSTTSEPCQMKIPFLKKLKYFHWLRQETKWLLRGFSTGTGTGSTGLPANWLKRTSRRRTYCRKSF